MISHPHWDDLLPRDKLPHGFTVLSKFTGNRVPKQKLPAPAKSAAQFHNNRGGDQQNRQFEYADGKLFRGEVLIADFAAMTPRLEESPEWARSW